MSEPTAREKIYNHRDTEVTEDKKFFSWPGDGGQEKVPPPSAEALLAGHQIVSEWAVVG